VSGEAGFQPGGWLRVLHALAELQRYRPRARMRNTHMYLHCRACSFAFSWPFEMIKLAVLPVGGQPVLDRRSGAWSW